MPDPQADKAVLRTASLARRDALTLDQRQQAAETFAARGLPVDLAYGTIVSGFFPMKSEIDPRPLMRALAARGLMLALPVVQGRGKPLLMRRWAFGEPLGSGVWGIREPLPDAPEVHPDIVLTPLAVFDRRGHRIGYGAGYYDMTIAALRRRKSILIIGVAFSVQEIARVPAEAHDEPLDLVLTEREVIDCRGR